MVPGTGIEPVRSLCRKAADFKSDVSTNFTTRAHNGIVKQKADSTAFQMVNQAADNIDDWRRDPESNRADRICNPVHNRFAIAPMSMLQPIPGTPPCIDKKGKPGLPFVECGAGKESRTLDLNLGKVALYQLSYSRVCRLEV